MVQRQTPRTHPYNTRSNKVKKVRTPGGNLVFHKVPKRGTIPKCSVCKKTLQGIKMARPAAFKRMKKKCRTVNRLMGGNTCGDCVKNIVHLDIVPFSSYNIPVRFLTNRRVIPTQPKSFAIPKRP